MIAQKGELNDIHITREKVGVQFSALNDFLKVGQDRIKKMLHEKLYNISTSVEKNSYF